MSSGVGGETTLVGIALIEDISPGHHGFAWVDWNFPSTLIHIFAMVRADCVADPALPFGTPITADDNQAQRNIDPAYGAPGYGGPEKAIDRTFIVRNELEKEAVFTIVPGKSKFKSKFIQQEIPKLADLRAISPLPADLRAIAACPASTIRMTILRIVRTARSEPAKQEQPLGRHTGRSNQLSRKSRCAKSCRLRRQVCHSCAVPCASNQTCRMPAASSAPCRACEA